MASQTLKIVKTGKIAYIVSGFPIITETFILYEILAMERLGVSIEMYPLFRKRESVSNPEIHRLIKRAHFHPFLSLSIILANMYFICRKPLVYVKSLAEVLKGTFGNANFFFGALAIFPKAVRFAYEMAEQEITHIHAQFAKHPTVAALIVHRLVGIPFSFTARGSDIHVDRRMLDRKLDAAAFAIAVSSYNKELMVNECGPWAINKIHVIYGGVDIELLRPRFKSYVNNKPFQILCVARFEEVKGHFYLVEACRLLQERGVDFQCHLIGEGPLRCQIEKLIARYGLGDRILLYGWCPYSDVIDKLTQTDVVVLATVPAQNGKREGIPNVLKEAMACGLPVISSLISGIPELVKDGVSGFLVPPQDITALADALQRLKDDPDLRKRMGRSGRQKIVSEFNLFKSTAKRAQLFLNVGIGQNDVAKRKEPIKI